MLAADGFVSKSEIELCLQEKDIKHIQNFKNDLCSEHPIKYDTHNNPYIRIGCKHICDSLYSYGLHHRKSWDLDINKLSKSIPNELENHFIRGLFDGDGSIKYYKYNYLKKCNFILDILDWKMYVIMLKINLN